VLCQPTSVRGLDLNVFDFDYDLTWFALMLSPEGGVLGRFGARGEETSGKCRSLRALRFCLEKALERQRRGDEPNPSQAAPRRPEDYPAARQLTSKACIHCHHVYEFRRAAMQDAGTWSVDDVWVYPRPNNIGLALDVDRGDRVAAVTPGSPAADAGMRAGDFLRTVHGMPIASVADVQYALHRSPAQGNVELTWQRQGETLQARLDLTPGWKKTDLSWRRSIKSLSPSPGVQGYDLTADEKQALGLPPAALAFRQLPFLSPEARHAGVQTNDVIVGVDRHRPTMTEQQFATFIRLTYQPGDVVRLHVVRGRERLELPLKLAK
jgi:hypothetical protein